MRVTTRVKGVHRVKRRLSNGKVKVFHYHRATGIALPDDPQSKEFIDKWQEAENAMRPTKRNGTIDALIDSFKDSDDYRRLRQSTRSIMNLNLNAVIKKYGTLPLPALDDKRVRSRFLQWHNEMAKTQKRAADAKLGALQRILSWAFDQGLIADNPLSKFRRAYKSDRSEKIWKESHIAAFNAVAPPEMQFALLLAVETGQRQDDLLKLRWEAYEGGSIRLMQAKTKTPITVPATKALKAAIEAAKGDKTAFTILTRSDGRPWTKSAFQKAWAAAFEASGIEDDLHFHDLRGTTVTRLGDAGCTIPEIASVTGHSLRTATRIIEAYLARTQSQASAAVAKLEAKRRTKL